MATSRVDYGDISRNGWDINNWFYGLPAIDPHGTLSSVVLHFPYVKRTGGAANGGKITVEISGSTLTVSDIKKGDEYKNLTLNITDYVSYNSSGAIYFKSGTYLNIKLYHNQVFIGSQSDWTLTGIYVLATYTQGSHSYTSSSVIVNPSCTTAGSTQYTCSCGHSYTDSDIPPALGHSFTNYVSDNNATCTADGTKTAKCDRCSATDTVVNAGTALGHNYVPTVVPPTEESHGYTRYDCSRCGHSDVDENSYTYLVRWYSEDGSELLEIDPSVPYGTMPEYNGATPTKAATAQYTYEHFGWNISPTAEGKIELTPVIANVKYYARFKATTIEYKVEWLDEDGTVLEGADWTPYGDPPSYDGPEPTKPDSPDGKYRYEFLGWSVKDVDDGCYDESELEPVTGHITYEAVYTPIVKQYHLSFITDDCTVEVVINGEIVEGNGYYDYGTLVRAKITPDVGYGNPVYRMIDSNGGIYDYEGDELGFVLTEDIVLECICERPPSPFFISPEQQVQLVYVVPAKNTIVYQVEGDLPELEVKIQSVDGWHLDVINTDMDEKYGLYAYYEVEQLYINDGKTIINKRIW